MPEPTGIYRGIVRKNDDSAEEHPHRGCLKVLVPQIYGPDIKDDDLPWCEPCLPYGGTRKDQEDEVKPLGLIAIPPIGASVWVAFECGDIRRPVWLGTWYGEPDGKVEMPDEAISDSRSGVAYPDIVLWRLPGGMYLRFLGDKRLEIVFEKDKTFLEMDAVTRKIKLAADTYAVEVSSKSGVVTLSAGDGAAVQSVVIDPAGTLTIQGIDIRIRSTNVEITAEQAFRVRSDSSQNSSASASGWERHP